MDETVAVHLLSLFAGMLAAAAIAATLGMVAAAATLGIVVGLSAVAVIALGVRIPTER